MKPAQHLQGRPRRAIWWVWMALVLPALACNLPTATAPASTAIPAEALRQTLAAPASGVPPSPTPPAATNAAATPSQPVLPPAQTTTPGSLPTAPAPGPDGYLYTTRPGDTREALAARFDIPSEQLAALENEPHNGYLASGQTLQIPTPLNDVTNGELLLPDSEVVYSPATVDFDLAATVSQAGGYLSTYQEVVDGEVLEGTAILQRVADELSVNPRLLLALLEFRGGWVYGQPRDPAAISNPLGFFVPARSGLYQEVMIAATQLNVGYYGWRQGTLLEIRYRRETRARLNPALNAGSAALQHLFSLLYREPDWGVALYGPEGFLALYDRLYGVERMRGWGAAPLFPPGLAQPALELPFLPGERWSLTAGPHPSWNAGTPRGALDFSPVTGEAVCAVSRAWARASAPGSIARAGNNALVLDLDGDGREQTGWVLIYYHLATLDLTLSGIQVAGDEPLGHPSCEGGRATGKHIHLARKYNGEWLEADGPLPFVLSGWQAYASESNYQGTLVKGDQVVSSNPGGSQTSIIIR